MEYKFNDKITKFEKNKIAFVTPLGSQKIDS